MTGRRISRAFVRLLIGIVVAPCAARGDESAIFPQTRLITPAAAAAATKGLEFLLAHQNDEGSFRASRSGGNVAICGLSGMAMLAAGSTPGRGPYGRGIDRCLDYILDNVSDEGVVLAPAATTNQVMYEHGFAALFLCECHGMADREDLRARIADAVQVIVGAQNNEGGWRYRPAPRDADVSVSVCQLMALRAARNAGIAVPRETVDRAVAYVKKCQNADGGFRYMLTAGDPVSEFPRSAAGVVALYNAGVYAGDEIERWLAYVEQFRPQASDEAPAAHYFYAHYYAVQAMWHAGGERWQSWYPAIRDDLLKRQQEDGSWRDGIGSEYATAIACIVLSTPNNYLPILQR